MLYLAALVLLLYLALLSSDYRKASTDNYQVLARQLSQLKVVGSSIDETDYTEWFEAETDARARLDDWIWKAGTAGLAVADFQAWVLEHANASEFKKTRLSLSELLPEEDFLSPVWKLEAEVTAEAEHHAVAIFLTGLAAHERRIQVERIRFTTSRSGGRLSMLLAAYFQLGSIAVES